MLWSEGCAHRFDGAFDPLRTSEAPSGTSLLQRRRTRTAVIEAATRLLGTGGNPSVDDVAALADVSRRRVYTYFPTLDQLLLDAALGALSTADIEAAFTGASAAGDDASARVDTLVRASSKLAPTTLPLGRTIVRLTVDPPGVEHLRENTMVRFINLFEVPAGGGEEVFEFWRTVNAYLVDKPGYVGHQLHRSLAEDAAYRFVNVAEWESRQAWDDAHDEGLWAIVKQASAKYTNTPALYEVIHTGGALH